MKKSLSLLVAIAMVFSMFATLVSADGKSAGQKLQELGVINGTSNGLDENEEWLRQDVTVLIARLLGSEEAAKATANTHGFEDLDSKFYNGFVSWAKEKGYFNGESATKFGVGNPITNQQFAAVLLRVLNVDVEYAEAFDKAVELGLVSKDLDKAANAIRGDIYQSLVTALDFKIDGKKLGTILGLKGYEITDVAVAKATATNSKTVVVEFNQEIGDVLASNFTVTEKGKDSVEVISSVSQSDSKATVKLVESLNAGKTYVITASGVSSKDGSVNLGDQASAEFSYTATTPASVSIAKTTVARNADIDIVIKDANGNDITDDIDLSDNDVVKPFTSDTSIVDIENNKLVAQGNDGYAVVNVQVVIDEDTTIETGNTVITVQESVAVVNGIDQITLGELGEDDKTTLFVEDVGQLKASVKNADGSTNEKAQNEAKFKSANPTVLAVDESGSAYAVKAGSATVTATTTFNGKTVSKSVVITVKAAAEFKSVDLDKSSVKLVYGLDDAIAETVKATLKNQFGDNFKLDKDTKVKIKASKANVVEVNDVVLNSTSDVELASLIDVDSYSLKVKVADGVDSAVSTNLTLTVGSIKKTISVSVVEAGALAGYVAEVDNTKIDINKAKTNEEVDGLPKDKNAVNEKTATVKVYAKDTKGNKIKENIEQTSDFTLVPEKNNGEGEFVSVVGNVISPKKAGTEKVTAYVNGIKAGTFTITVVDTRANVSKIVQSKNAITISQSDDLLEKLFGDNSSEEEAKKGGAFVAYNQYGSKISFYNSVDKLFDNNDIKFYSSNKDVVDNQLSIGKTGTVLLTVVVKDKVYTITVVVK